MFYSRSEAEIYWDIFYMMLFIFIYVRKKRDEFGYKRGNPGSWTKKLYGWLTLSMLDTLNSLIGL